MSTNQFIASSHASSSSHPHATTSAFHNPAPPRPRPLAPPTPVNTQAIKQELHDALGENGLPYWKTMNGYLLGQVGRSELEGMVRGWLKPSQIHLHNKLLISLLHNASTEPNAANGLKKRQRVSPDDAAFDIDETSIEPKRRVSQWLSGLTTRDRSRLKRLMTRAPPEQEDEDWLAKSRASASFTPGDQHLPPFAPDRFLPSAAGLAQRLGDIARSNNLSIAPDASADIGEFLSVGVDAHISEVLHSIVHLTSQGRPGHDSLHIPQGHFDPDEDTDGPIPSNMPRPTVETLQQLFNMYPSLHPQSSPALYKLATSQHQAESGSRRATLADEDLADSPLADDSRDIKPTANTLQRLNGPHRQEMISRRLLDSGLVKIDKAEEGKKKHAFHWRYEDPATLLGDILG